MSVHLDQVQRWLQAGGTYEVLTDRDGVVVIALFSCSREEEMRGCVPPNRISSPSCADRNGCLGPDAEASKISQAELTSPA